MEHRKKQLIFRMQRTGLAIVLAFSMVAVSLLVLQLNVFAKFAGGGAGGCYNFIDAVANVNDGDTIAQMVPPRASNGATISKNIIIQGGWDLGSTSGCVDVNINTQEFTDATSMMSLGFVFNGPMTRSTLTHNSSSVITIDPKVLTLTVQHMAFQNTGNTTAMGAGISGIISNGAKIRLDNIAITNGTTTGKGGGLYLEVRGGSHLVISDSQFISNTSPTGGGFEIQVFDNSTVEIYNTQVARNSATTGNGGGARIVINSGAVIVADSTFSNNKANSGNGGGLSLESTGSGTVTLRNNTFSNNSASTGATKDLHTSGQLTVFQHYIFLPAVIKSSGLSAAITNISLNGSTYVVTFQTTGFTPQTGQTHVHFFFNTVPPNQAGVPGTGPWKVYESAAPFTGYSTADRPGGATQMCILVANANHSVQQGTGNCFALP